MIPKCFMGSYTSGYTEERLIDICKEFHKFDIICIQEAWGVLSETKGVLIALAQKAGFIYIASLDDPNFNQTYLGDGGLMILSRFQILQSEFIPFSFGILNDGWTRRGILYAEIAVGGTLDDSKSNAQGGKISNFARLHIFNTHAQSSQFIPTNEEGAKNLKEAIQCRTEQMRELSSYVYEKIKSANKIKLQSQIENPQVQDLALICGDLNISKTKLTEVFCKRILKESTSFADCITDLDLEFRILQDLLSQGYKNTAIDLLERDNPGVPLENLCTYGDTYKNELGEEIPLETVLTLGLELQSKMLLDYIFEYKISVDQQIGSTNAQQSQNNILKVVSGSTKLEKFFIKGRPYTQLSDHYGISTLIQYCTSGEQSKKENQLEVN